MKCITHIVLDTKYRPNLIESSLMSLMQVKMSGLVVECVELKQPSLSLQQPSSPRTPLPLTPIHPHDQTMVSVDVAEQ